MNRYNSYKSITNRYRRCVKHWLRNIVLVRKKDGNLNYCASIHRCATYLQSNIQ